MATHTGWRSPALLGLLGLALMVGGWKLASWTREPAGLVRLRELARQQEREDGPGEGGLAERLEEMARPYRVAGRVLIFVGLALFVTAGVLMYRRPEPEPEQQKEEGATEEGNPGG